MLLTGGVSWFMNPSEGGVTGSAPLIQDHLPRGGRVDVQTDSDLDRDDAASLDLHVVCMPLY